MMLFYRSYLITFGLLFAGIAALVISLDNSGAISLHWGFAVLAVIAFIAGLALFLTGAFGRPATVERWADRTSIHEEGTAYVALLALPVYAVLWCFSRDDARPSATLPIIEMRKKRARRRARRQ